MSKQRHASVWDAIEDTPAEVENMKLRSELMMALKKHIIRTEMSQALGGQVQIHLAGLFCLLLEAMQHIDDIDPLRHINDAERAGGVPYPNLFHTLANARHRLPVVRLQTVLHLVELMACLAPGRQGKGTQVVEGAAAEIDRFGAGHAANIQNIVLTGNRCEPSRPLSFRAQRRISLLLLLPPSKQEIRLHRAAIASASACRA